LRSRIYRFESGDPSDSSLSVLFVRLLVNLVGLSLASVIVPGIVIGDIPSLVAAAAIFAIVNMLLKPLAMLVSCCLIVATFGLFVLVVNTALLGATAWVSGQLGLDFTIDSFWSAFSGAIIISLVSVFSSVAIRRRRTISR
jgi:putative membrane protein